MAFSSGEGKGFFADWIANFANPQGYKRYLDIGCGAGHYGKILRMAAAKDAVVDAVEVFPEYIERHHLREIYGDIIISDIRQVYEEIQPYDIMIMGDVLEHLTKEEAIAVVNGLKIKCCFIWVALPMKIDRPWSFGYDQLEEEWAENEYGRHLHDWTGEELQETFKPLWIVPYRMTGITLIEGSNA
jgi:trans-aconitate methyltransferase